MPDGLAADDPQLAILLDRIVAAFRPEAVYLFGSRATGTARPDSDYDLLVVVPDETPDEKATIHAGFRAVRGSGIAADVFPVRRHAFEAYKDRVGTLTYEAWHFGRQVHGG